MSLTTAEQLRACHVRRWHIVQVAREQTLAEHSFAVAVIAGSLAAAMRWKGLMHNDLQLKLLQWSLSHDIIEVRTGDVPTPFKRFLEQAGGEGVVEKAEDLVDSDYGGVHREMRSTDIGTIVKLADQIEAIYFLQDNGLGAHALQVLDGLRDILSKMVVDIEAGYPHLNVRGAVRQVCKDIGIHGGWL
jgi:5'-deoxynucleotidase YfbR-like HD superfamily hydrolase